MENLAMRGNGELGFEPAQISFKQLTDWLDGADFNDANRIGAVMETYNPGAKPEPNDHFSYVLTYFDQGQNMFQAVVDSRDGSITETAIQRQNLRR